MPSPKTRFPVAAVALLLGGLLLATAAVLGRDGPPGASPTIAPTDAPPPNATAGITPPATGAVSAPSLPPPVAPAATIPSGASFLPLVFAHYTPTACDPNAGGPGPATLDGNPAVWQPLALRFAGPATTEAASAPNPFLDFRLTVRFVAPSGRAYDVPGTFDGDGRGGGAGNQWTARFAADEPGRWRYCASFRAGPNVAVSLDSAAGQPTHFNGAAGAFDVAPAPAGAPGFLRWGRLEYVGGHYLKFRDGPYFIKTGTNSPENFLAYNGFQDTFDFDGHFLHTYADHIADWRAGDPTLPGAPDQGRGIIGAINYLAAAGVNSIYFLPMNLGGDGDDTWPFLSPDDIIHYDVGKLAQWRGVFEHAQRRGVALHVVLNENEPANRRWLDRQPAADSPISVARRLYYRELVARFADLPAVKWNLSEEIAFTAEETLAYAGYLAALDWAGHPIALHNPADWLGPLTGVLGRPEFSATSIQYQIDDAGALVEAWRAASTAAGRPWVVDMDENRPAQEGLTPDNAGPLRKTVLYDVLFSGGHIEWYAGEHPLPAGGDLNLENFRTRDAMWTYSRHARRFLEQYTPFWLMVPADQLLSGEAGDFGGGEVLALPGQLYAIYLPTAIQPARLVALDGAYSVRWYDPREGVFAGEPLAATAVGGALSLGAAPYNAAGDWVLLVAAAGYALPTPSNP